MKRDLFPKLLAFLLFSGFSFASAQQEICIPAGKVVLGNFPEGYGNYPAQVMYLPEYSIDRHEVTNQEFAQFVDDSAYSKIAYWIIGGANDSLAGWRWKETNQIQSPKFWNLSQTPYWRSDEYSRSAETPVLGISWYEAYAYAKWAGKQLPTAAQWEKAARGTSEQYGNREEVGVGYKYPWGNDFFKGQTPPEYHLCNWRLLYWKYGYPDKTKIWTTDGCKLGVAPVGSYSPAGDSPYGVADMAGNVWEWCLDWHKEFPQLKTLRGGAWFASDMDQLRTAFEYGIGPETRSHYIGFRCVKP
jgi:formylglycine-generating enzyme required for sulfatase activity